MMVAPVTVMFGCENRAAICSKPGPPTHALITFERQWRPTADQSGSATGRIHAAFAAGPDPVPRRTTERPARLSPTSGGPGPSKSRGPPSDHATMPRCRGSMVTVEIARTGRVHAAEMTPPTVSSTLTTRALRLNVNPGGGSPSTNMIRRGADREQSAPRLYKPPATVPKPASTSIPRPTIPHLQLDPVAVA